MPKLTTKVKSKGVIKDFIKSMEGLKKPLGAKLVIPTDGDSSLTDLSWLIFQEFGVYPPGGTYTIEPRPGTKALSFPRSKDFINPPPKNKRGINSIDVTEPDSIKTAGALFDRLSSNRSIDFIKNKRPLQSIDVSQPNDIYTGKVVALSVEHPGFPALHFIRDTLAEKIHGIEAVKIEVGEELIVGIGRKPNRKFNPQKIGKVLVKHLKDIKEAIAQKMEVILKQKRFDDQGKLQGQEPADVFRKRAKVVSAAKFGDEE